MKYMSKHSVGDNFMNLLTAMGLEMKTCNL